MAFEPGRPIGPYDIVSVLGSGGMGTVYLALDRRLKRQVALKFLHADDGTTGADEWHRALLREAQIASALNHPNICHVYDVGGEGRESWIAMEYVDGRPLGSLIPDGGLPTATATQIAGQIAEALAHAHAQGVLHRDLKSANVVRDTAGRVKILDFGIAGRLPAAVAREVTHTEALAEAPVIQGTLPYLAPEILRNATATEQSDLWSLGVLMYEMLTGSLPFKGGSTFELASAILDGPVPPLPARVPSPLARLVQRLLSKDPSERYGSAKEVAAALDAIAPAPQTLRPRVTARAALLVASILALAIVSYGVWRSRQPVRVEVSGQRLLSTMERSHRAPAYSPDGRRLAFLAPDTEGITQIWVRDLSEDAALQVTSGPVGAGRPRWSAATDRLVFARGNQGIWSVSPLGGAPTRITDRGFNPNLSRDGRRMVFESDSRLWTAAADGSDVHVVDGVSQVYYSIPMGPSLSPDGTLIAYFRPAAGPNGDLWVVPAGGGVARQLTFDLREGGWPVWTADGRTIVFSSARAGSRTLWQIPARGGDPVPVTSGAGEDDQPDISADSRQLAYTNVRNTWELRVRDLEAGTERSLLRRGLEIVFPMFSPDGQRIHFFGRSDRAVAIFTIGADGSDLRQLTGGRELNHQPRWDSQGQFVYFFQVEPELSFRRVPSLGGPSVRFRDWKWETHFAPTFDPSGRMMAYARLREPGQTGGEPDRTVIHDVATGEERFWPVPVTFVTSWSADSRRVIGSRRDGTVVMCEVADATCRVLTNGAQPVWPAGSERVFFLRQTARGGSDQLWSIRTDGSGEALVTEVGHFRSIDRFFDASRTGQVVWAPFRAGQSELWAAALR
jgi:Tol biopolymer transport system component/predicted Ser/Thr protein kinase